MHKQKVTTSPGLNISCAFANCATAIQPFPAITKMRAIMATKAGDQLQQIVTHSLQSSNLAAE